MLGPGPPLTNSPSEQPPAHAPPAIRNKNGIKSATSSRAPNDRQGEWYCGGQARFDVNAIHETVREN